MKLNKTCAIIADKKKREGLLPLTAKRPVSLLPFNGVYRMIDFNLSNIKDAKINSTFMIFNQGMTQSVIDHISSGREWDLNSLPNRSFMHFYQEADDEEHYFDSVVEYIEKSDAEFTLFMGNKMLYNIDLNEVIDVHKTHKKDITVVYKNNPVERITSEDLIFEMTQEGLVINTTLFSEELTTNETEKMYMNLAIVNSRWLLDELAKWRYKTNALKIEDIIREGIKVKNTWAVEYTGYLSNIHDIKSYYDANMSMLSPKKYLSLAEASKNIYMKNVNEVPTYYATTSDVNNSQISAGCLIYGEVRHSILSSGVKIEENAEVSHSILMSKATVEDKAVVKHAILDKNVVVESGVKVIGSVEKPLVIKKNTRVVKDMVQVEENINEGVILHG